MSGIRRLVKDTAIYGLSSIVGRFLNWCLVPMYTHLFPAEEYGIVTLVYAVVALALVILTYGLETGFFRFANHERWKDPMQVYSTGLISLGCSSTGFIILVMCLLNPITHWMECDGHSSYVWMMAVAVAIDAFTSLPFAYLRYKQRPVRYAMLRLVNIGLNIGLNLFFLLLCPWLMKTAPSTVSWFYITDFGVGYIFLSNLIASAVTLVMVIPELRGFRWRFTSQLWKEMIGYSWPLLVLGVAGIMNQALAQILYPSLAGGGVQAMNGLGIYGANYKIAIVMVMFTQAFRFAYEPLVFSRSKDKDAKKVYSDSMKYFVIFTLLIFMAVMFYLPILKYFISPKYFSGLKVVPIIMAGEVFYGIFFNLSIWYKLTDKTVWGMCFSLAGLAVTIALNVILVPRYGYMGCAWASFFCYGTMMLASYFVGQRKFPIAYPIKKLLVYFVVSAALYVVGLYLINTPSEILTLALRTILIVVFIAVVVKLEHIRISDFRRHISKAPTRSVAQAEAVEARQAEQATDLDDKADQ